MKKINANMRGFTLLEIIIVVAIILVISAAAFTGVAVTLNNAQQAQQYLADNNGDNFEVEARTEIKNLEAGVVDWSAIPKYTPKKKADEEIAVLKAFGWKDEEIEVTYGDTGYVITKTWNPELHDGKTYEEYLAEYNAAHNKTNTSGSNSQQGQGQQGQGQQGQGQQGQGQDQQGQGQQGQDQQGQQTTSGSSFNGTYASANTVTSGKGVYSISEDTSGKTTVSLATDSVNNRVGFTLEKVGNNYVLSPNNDASLNAGSGWYTLDNNVFPDTWKFQSYTLNDEQKAWLAKYGVTLE